MSARAVIILMEGFPSLIQSGLAGIAALAAR
jgi:hypothetical protein